MYVVRTSTCTIVRWFFRSKEQRISGTSQLLFTLLDKRIRNTFFTARKMYALRMLANDCNKLLYRGNSLTRNLFLSLHFVSGADGHYLDIIKEVRLFVKILLGSSV